MSTENARIAQYRYPLIFASLLVAATAFGQWQQHQPREPRPAHHPSVAATANDTFIKFMTCMEPHQKGKNVSITSTYRAMTDVSNGESVAVKYGFRFPVLSAGDAPRYVEVFNLEKGTMKILRAQKSPMVQPVSAELPLIYKSRSFQSFELKDLEAVIMNNFLDCGAETGAPIYRRPADMSYLERMSDHKSAFG